MVERSATVIHDTRWRPGLVLALAALLGACQGGQPPPSSVTALTPATHTRFQIASGSHAIDCLSCHGAADSFTRGYDCLGCHVHERGATDKVHAALAPAQGSYSYASTACYSCHHADDGKRGAFSHTGVSNGCALCHAEQAPFAALPVAGFTHQPTGSNDCSACHVTADWTTSSIPALAADPARVLSLTAQIPTWSGTAIASFVARAVQLPMPMVHGSSQLDAAVMGACTNCHLDAGSGAFYPGALHSSLSALGASQPSTCNECHGASVPPGFVGPLGTQPPRTPPSGEMRHDAVAWNKETPTTSKLVTQDCAVCHVVPAAGATTPWRAGFASAPARFHASLARGGAAQPASCNDCHANNRPTQLTAANASGLPAGLAYDHTISPSQSDCVACHTATGTGDAWAGGRYHHVGDATPSTCLPCHQGERPSAAVNPTSGWKNANYKQSPFDTLTNAQGIGHGNGNDCAACHTGPGTGAWGVNQDWASGAFPHGPGTDAASTCVACHSSQRPDLQPGTTGSTSATVLQFDHALNGRGDCFGCHQATVAAKSYATYAFPGGDWKGGQTYPGSNLIGSSSHFVSTTEFTLLRTSPSNPALVTGVSQVSATLYNQFLHTSSAIPPSFGLSANPDTNQCWHCHANDGAGHVTAFADGQYHASLDAFSATPGGAVTPLSQATGKCADCHTQRPANIVARPVGTPPVPSPLQPMDHAALFAAAVTVGSVQASGAASFDCSACHTHPGGAWTDGTFHQNVGAAVPKDCTVCHYQLMADPASSNKVSGRDYAMKHLSSQLAAQNCQGCHAGALAKGANTPIAPTLWSGGAFHGSVPAQPAACLDCHAISVPGAATASALLYAMPKGGTGSNLAQWMSHASPAVAGKDCATCHAADAKAAGSAWSRSAQFHATTSPTTCQACHGLGNGSSTPGSNNNLPAGLIDSTTPTTASNDPATGIPAGTPDQIDHADANVAAHDCAFCHTQSGPSTASGIQGKEWAQARFHASFSGANPLVIDGATGRCSNCHLNLKPGPAFTGYDHTGLTSAPGTQDCAACHQAGPSWVGSLVPAGAVGDPAQTLLVTGGVPSYSGMSIVSVTARAETLPMQMVHASAQVPAAVIAACVNCHLDAGSGAYYPGTFHASLAAIGAAQPVACLDCHGGVAPVGFVGPTATNPARSPPSAEMKHDAVAWAGGKPGSTALVAQECAQCHLAPLQVAPGAWGVGRSGTAPALYHASLAAAPSSCVDCHANSRPAGVLTPAGAALPAGVKFDHVASNALGDCASCHAGTSSWTGGRFHLQGSSAPSTCASCHEGERPASTANWKSTTYAVTPFDYGGNSLGNTHGDGLDCASCHAGPGTGAWGGTQNWAGGAFAHGAGTPAASTCVACHSSQRPDLVGVSPSKLPGSFDHATSGTGDCTGCHQATVVRAGYAAYLPIPGGDWRGGVGYPGDTLIGATDQNVIVTELQLNRGGAANLVVGTSSSSATLYNQMLHSTSGGTPPPGMPSEVYPGPAASPDATKCWHCHTNTNGTVSSFLEGKFHAPLSNYSATPGGAVTPLPQPSTSCLACHALMRPGGIVEKSGSDLQPMDHGAALSLGTVAQMDCASCHAQPGDTWTDGAFHARLGSATPGDCVACHYPLMADAAKADVGSGANFVMKHASAQLAVQACDTCHAAALSMAKTTPLASSLWQGGALHPSVAAQPTLCADCHQVSLPASDTQSGVTYLFAKGGTSSNGAQWMNHGATGVVGKDCAVCHLADAKASGAAWSKLASFHAATPGAAACSVCHGLGNGVGSTTPGTSNNLPLGLTDSTALTTASSDPTTGVPVGTHDQISHADINVTGRDCNACHTQAGASSTPGVKGVEWAQASFHANFTAVTPLILNGTTGRCSNCHLNVKPGAAFTGTDHSTFTAAAGTQDCSGCHTWPGTGSAASPNWLGAAGAPATVTLTGWSSGTSITSNTVTFAHPGASSYTSCAQCHPGSNNSILIDYNHDGLQSNVTINGVAVSPAPNLGTGQFNASTNRTFCVACHNNSSPWISNTGLSSTITANTTSGSTTVTAASTSALTAGMTITGSGIPSATTTTQTFSASTTAGSTTVTTATKVSLSSGTVISGPGIPANDTVASSVSNATTFTLRTAATATATGVTLTATKSTPVTVTIKSISGTTAFVLSTAADTTVSGTTLTVTHYRITQAAIGNHQGSTSGQDCTSCHYVGGNQKLTPPTAGTFGTGTITGG